MRSVEGNLSEPKIRQYPLARNQSLSAFPGMEAPGPENAKRLLLTPEQVQQRHVLDGEVVALAQELAMLVEQEYAFLRRLATAAPQLVELVEDPWSDRSAANALR